MMITIAAIFLSVVAPLVMLLIVAELRLINNTLSLIHDRSIGIAAALNGLSSETVEMRNRVTRDIGPLSRGMERIVNKLEVLASQQRRFGM